MGISTILQIADRLLSGEFQQNTDENGNVKQAATASTARTAEQKGGDRFRPSQRANGTNSAAEAGIFQLEQFRLTAINMEAGSPATVPQTAGAATQTTVRVPTAAAPAAASGAQNAVATIGPTSAAAVAQDSLQSLNAAVVSLGLNPAEIAAFDQFAKLLLQFNPNALQDLQNQLHELAAEFSANNNANATPAATTAGTTATAPQATTTAAPPSQQGYHLTELSVSFTGINETSTLGGNTSQCSAFQLQVREVQVSLASAVGKTVRVQSAAPQATAAPVTAATPAFTKAATA